MRYPLHYMVSLLVIIDTMSDSCKQILASRKSDIHRLKLSLLPKLDYLSTEKEIGVVDTLRNYIQWHIKEEKLVDHFRSRIKQIQTHHKLIKRFFQRRQRKCHNNVIKYTAKLLESIWKVLENSLQTISAELDLLGTRFLRNKWIGSKDLLISMSGISHLQNVYFIPASQVQAKYKGLLSKRMSIGLTFDSHYGGLLSQLEMVLQALHALSKNRYVTVISWLQEAISLKKKKLSSDLLHSIFFIGIQSHNSKCSRQADTNKQNSIFNADIIDDVYKFPILNGLLPSKQTNRMEYFLQYRSIDTHLRLTDICNGKNLQSTNQLSKLHCYIDNKKDPYLYINPVKIEQLSLNPPIFQFYEIMSNKTIEGIVTEVGPHVTTLNLWFDEENFAHGNPPVSVTNSARMGINFGSVSKATRALTGILSGLTVWNGPNHNRYGEHVYGRHFNLHNDGLQTKPINEIPEDNDIMATMVFYLRVPRVGGCTAFVHAGICSRNVPGSAVFWYNMHKNGSYTTELKHGSCPVYHGEKIAISLFLKQNANWNKRLCSLDKLK